jgi:hypothetical protein
MFIGKRVEFETQLNPIGQAYFIYPHLRGLPCIVYNGIEKYPVNFSTIRWY